MARPIRVLLAKIGLDGHDRGVKIVARALRDAGMEVVYTGLHRRPAEVVRTAIDEDVDVIGVSVLSGAQMTIFPALLTELREEGGEDIVVIGGGTILPGDVEKLQAIGVRKVFGVDTPLQEIVDAIREAVAERAGSRRPGPRGRGRPSVGGQSLLGAGGDHGAGRTRGDRPREAEGAGRLLLRALAVLPSPVGRGRRRAGDVAGLDDLARFPFVPKDAIRVDQETHSPFGSNVCCPPRRSPVSTAPRVPPAGRRHSRSHATTGRGSGRRAPVSCGASACDRPTPSSSPPSSACTSEAGVRSPERRRSAQGRFRSGRPVGADGARSRLPRAGTAHGLLRHAVVRPSPRAGGPGAWRRSGEPRLPRDVLLRRAGRGHSGDQAPH